ncbi:HlyD family secretion protein [Thalassovita taeanensis]|uniref:Barrel-sandwich domain of CusB or HlyD membrane-fusion n=1 Tax=Thalassovita taeanensis TaxID=657014 RepID=A0A1H9DGG5_9RHOB|nr:HlyD family secretion protein [Thalassovita taeanensis]SEQ12602.1 Barrel-sandwich domain of CusB or HlyD membrane-fusion [Thalassovita taeanensis]
MTDLTPAADAAAETERANPVKKIAMLVVVLLLSIVSWYALSDYYVPSNSRAIVSARVAQIAPRVSGRVTRIDVADNAQVEVGTPLFHLDERPFVLAVERARAQLQQATQSIDASSAQLAASQANVAQARVSLEAIRQASDRTLTLAERGLVSTAATDQARTNVENAEAALAAAIAQSESAARQLGVSGEDNPQIKTAQLTLESAEYDLRSTTVTAPRHGVVTNLNLAAGQYVSAGTPALTFIDRDTAWITADMRENQLVNVEPGDPVDVLFDAVPGHIYEGRVQSIAWGINPGRTQAGGLPVNTPSTQWFEPARQMPIRIELDGGMEDWPEKARMGGKAKVLIYARGRSNPVSAVARTMLKLQSLTTVFY